VKQRSVLFDIETNTQFSQFMNYHLQVLGYLSNHFYITFIMGNRDTSSLFSLFLSANEHLRKWRAGNRTSTDMM